MQVRQRIGIVLLAWAWGLVAFAAPPLVSDRSTYWQITTSGRPAFTVQVEKQTGALLRLASYQPQENQTDPTIPELTAAISLTLPPAEATIFPLAKDLLLAFHEDGDATVVESVTGSGDNVRLRVSDAGCDITITGPHPSYVLRLALPAGPCVVRTTEGGDQPLLWPAAETAIGVTDMAVHYGRLAVAVQVPTARILTTAWTRASDAPGIRLTAGLKSGETVHLRLLSADPVAAEAGQRMLTFATHAPGEIPGAAPKVLHYALRVSQRTLHVGEDLAGHWEPLMPPGHYLAGVARLVAGAAHAPVTWLPVPLHVGKEKTTLYTSRLPAGVYRLRVVVEEKEPAALTRASTDLRPFTCGETYLVIQDTAPCLSLAGPEGRAYYYAPEEIPVCAILKSADPLPSASVSFTVRDEAGIAVGDPVSVRCPAGVFRQEARAIIRGGQLRPGKYRVAVSWGRAEAEWPFTLAAPEAVSPFVLCAAGEIKSLGADRESWPTVVRGTAQWEPEALPMTPALATVLALPAASLAPEVIALNYPRTFWPERLAAAHIGSLTSLAPVGVPAMKANTLPEAEDPVRRAVVQTAAQWRARTTTLGIESDSGVTTVREVAQNTLPPAFTARLETAQEDAFQHDRAGDLALTARLPAAERECAEQRLRADWLADIWARLDGRDHNELRRLDPTLALAASRGIDTLADRDPRHLFQGVDVQVCEDGVALPLGLAARAIYNPRQPVWSALRIDPADPYRSLLRGGMAALAQGCDGLDYALETLSRTATHDEKVGSLFSFLRRVGPLFARCKPLCSAALLVSRTEAICGANAARVSLHAPASLLSLPYAWFTRCQYPPALLTEEAILNGELTRFPVLCVAGQTAALPPAVMARLVAWGQGGGKIITDEETTLALPGAVVISGLRFQPEQEARALPALRQALAPLCTTPGYADGEHITLSWLTGGGAHYLVMQAEDGAPIQTVVHLTAKPAVVYDLLNGKDVPLRADNTFIVDCRTCCVHLYALLPEPIDGLRVSASPTPRVGEELFLTAQLLGAQEHPLEALAPAAWEVRDPHGQLRASRQMTIGAGQPPLRLALSAADLPGRYLVRVTEGLSGRTAETIIQVFPARGRPQPVAEDTTNVAVTPEDARAIGQFLAPDTTLTILLEPPQHARRAQAETLAAQLLRRGIHTEIWEAPPIIAMPVGWEFTAEQLARRATVLSGGAVGEPYRVSNVTGDRTPSTWEPTSGVVITRRLLLFGLPGENRYLDALTTGVSRPSLRYAASPFHGGDDAVLATASDEEGLQHALEALVALPTGAPLTGLQRARLAVAGSLNIRPLGVDPRDLPRPARMDRVLAPCPVTVTRNGESWETRLGVPADAAAPSENAHHP